MKKTLEQLIKALPDCSVLEPSIPKNQFVAIDLSRDSDVLNHIDVSSSQILAAYIDDYIAEKKARYAYGGYMEVRNIYQRSTYFKNNMPGNERYIHLGLDIWAPSETGIFTPLDATLHSFKNNINFGDYGPTIILRHEIEGTGFYTLYGHLSLESLAHLEIGQTFKQGEQIGALGDASVNGDYPPHLHFQIMADIQDYFGDYPGVSSKDDFEFYKQNCLDPSLLLGLE